MTGPIEQFGVSRGLATGVPGSSAPSGASEGDGFATMLREQLEKVNSMHSQASDELAKFVTGESANMSDVFVATRKAQVAFTLLMEIRNKLVQAYEELQNMRV
jgi:flagellar hook-basal body complex protein FliE